MKPNIKSAYDGVNKVTRLLKRIKKIKEEIKAIQAACPHPSDAREIKISGYYGGWDQDMEWEEHRCLVCERQWEGDKKYV